MKLLKVPLTACGLLLMLIPVTAFAQGIIQTIGIVGGGLPFFTGTGTICNGNTGCGFVAIAEGIVIRFRPLLTVVGLLTIVIFGYRMIVSQEDDVISKARNVMSSVIAGLIMVWLIEPFILAFYGPSGEVPRGAMAAGAGIVNAQVNGLVNWVMVIVAALAVMMLILSALKAVGQSTSEEGVANMRKTIFSVVIGIILLVFRYILSLGFVATTGNPIPILAHALRIVSFLMGFLAMVCLLIVVFAGFRYVLSLGKEEQATKSKDLLIRAGIGVIVILVSLAIVNFIIIPGVT